uniref:Uncharacterized protein n=1 Tax=Arundo donax TaxID=35708 RepID=A0A0A9HRE9_ARUDO
MYSLCSRNYFLTYHIRKIGSAHYLRVDKLAQISKRTGTPALSSVYCTASKCRYLKNFIVQSSLLHVSRGMLGVTYNEKAAAALEDIRTSQPHQLHLRLREKPHS